jgi:thiamine-phosphate pyrophosphorylase
MLHKLQYISQGKDPLSHLENVKTALDAGVKLIQLRLKNITLNEYLEYGSKAFALCKNYDSALIINDNPMVAVSCGAEAVHLGLDDMSVDEAKKITGNKIIGGTANTFDHILQRSRERVDYIGLGPFRFTTTKEKLSPVLGVSGYEHIISKMREKKIEIPVYAIGGIELKDVESIMRTGVFGIAVSGLITNSSNKEKTVKEINKILYHA